jgi:hypothetical protein
MVQVYNRCLTTMTKSYGANKQVGIQYTKHLRRSYQYAITENAAGGIKED